MKNIFLSCLLLLVTTSVLVSQNTLASPRDSASGKIDDASVSVNYGSPSVKGRKIWGKLVPFGKVWRTGANEATRFTTSKDLLVEGQTLAAGTYGLFTIPGEKTWTVIFNKVSRQWGAFEYSDKEDALRVTVAPNKSDTLTERLNFAIEKNQLVMRWENIALPVKVATKKGSE